MRQEKKDLYNQEHGRQQGQEQQEKDLNQKPNVQEVGLDRELEEGRKGNQELGREKGEERITEGPDKSDRRL
ncbi:MAG: hypothetical protein EOP56_08430 [Sphingobacteriales bacterium]|nr:MAG: hypothetical protein EOP56_08430 [Sphingobacteriales bacterium]